jgi:ABC-type bacteriocin/lantibiotic exporter with double-glycine peptidase domain
MIRLWTCHDSRFVYAVLVTVTFGTALTLFTEKTNAAIPIPNSVKFEPSWRDGGDCGPISLYVLMRLQDRQVSVTDVKSVLPFDPKTGCSLAALARAADTLDFTTEIRFVNPKDVSNLPYPFILYSEGSLESGVGHFQVVVGYIPTERRYYIIDTTYEILRTQSEESLLRDFAGYVLLPKNSVGAIDRHTAILVLICMGCTIAVVAVLFYPFRKKNH